MLVRRPLSRQASDRVGTGKKGDKKSGSRSHKLALRFRHFWGKQKRKELLASLNEDNRHAYQPLLPVPELGLAFMPAVVGSGYLKWPKLPELLPTSFPGVKTSRDVALVDFDVASLKKRMSLYFDPAVSNEQVKVGIPVLMADTQRFKASSVPASELGLVLVPLSVSSGYTGWPNLPELFPFNSPGVKTSRDMDLVDIDRDSLRSGCAITATLRFPTAWFVQSRLS